MKKVSVKGKIFNIRTHSNGDLEVIDEVFTNDCYNLNNLKKSLRKPKLILDIGGHIGTFGVLAKTLWPEAKLIAFEVDSDSHALYVKNMKDNKFKNWHVYNKGITFNLSAVCFVNAELTTGGGMLVDKSKAGGIVDLSRKRKDAGQVKECFCLKNDNVETISIEEVFVQHNIKKVDLAKWDCEGCEIDAFINMSRKTADKFDYILGEYHAKSCDDFLAIAKKCFPKHDLFTSGKSNLSLFTAIYRERRDSFFYKNEKAVKLYDTANYYLQNNERKKAISTFKQVVKLVSENPTFAARSAYKLGQLSDRKNQKDKYYAMSIDILKRVKEKSNGDIYMLASALKNVDDFKSARKWFNHIVNSKNDLHLVSGAEFHLGEICLIEMSQKASKHFRASLKLNPQHVKAKAYQENISSII